MIVLNATEKWGLGFIVCCLLLGQGVALGRRAVEARYLYRDQDRAFAAAVALEEAAARRAQLASRPVSLRIDPNTAAPGELECLPGVGPVIAARIVECRRARPFVSPRDLLAVPGIGPKTLERMLPCLEFSAGKDRAGGAGGRGSEAPGG